MDSLTKELSNKSNASQNQIVELDKQKFVNTQLTEQSSKQEREIDSLRNELAALQKTNQQLKILARKYKSKCDDYQKQQQGSSNDANVSNNAKDFEERLRNLNSEYERLQIMNEAVNKENKRLRIQMGKMENRLELALKTKQRAMHFDKVNAALQPNQNAKYYGAFVSGKLPVSSTIVSASNQQPSTSSFEPVFFGNILSSSEDNDRLQSAQISSHTTTMEDNNLELFVNHVSNSSKKRKITNQDSLKRKRELETDQTVLKENDDSTEISETCQIDTMQDENNFITTDDGPNVQSNEEQAESNDGNASSCNFDFIFIHNLI